MLDASAIQLAAIVGVLFALALTIARIRIYWFTDEGRAYRLIRDTKRRIRKHDWFDPDALWAEYLTEITDLHARIQWCQEHDPLRNLVPDTPLFVSLEEPQEPAALPDRIEFVAAEGEKLLARAGAEENRELRKYIDELRDSARSLQDKRLAIRRTLIELEDELRAEYSSLQVKTSFVIARFVMPDSTEATRSKPDAADPG